MRCLVVVVAVASVLTGCGKVVGMDRDAGAEDGAAATTGPPQWAMFAATPQRNGRSAFEGPRLGGHRVVALSENAERARVMVEAVGPMGTVYVIVRNDTSGDRLFSLQPDGAEIWEFPHARPFLIQGAALRETGDLFVQGQRIVEGTDPWMPQLDMVFKLQSNNQLAWSWHPEEPILVATSDSHSSPMYNAVGRSFSVLPIIFSPDHHERERYLAAISPGGEMLWQWERDVGRACIPPAMTSNGLLYVLVARHSQEDEQDEGLYVLDDTGAQLRFTPLPEYWLNTVAVADDGTAYVAGDSSNGPMVVAVGTDGEIAWTYFLEHGQVWMVTTTVAIAADGTLFVGAESINSDQPGALYAISPDGALKWWAETPGDPCGGLAVDATGAVYTLTGGSDGAMLLGFEADGQERLAVEVSPSHDCNHVGPSFFTSSVVLADGRLYFGSVDGVLHIIE